MPPIRTDVSSPFPLTVRLLQTGPVDRLHTRFRVGEDAHLLARRNTLRSATGRAGNAEHSYFESDGLLADAASRTTVLIWIVPLETALSSALFRVIRKFFYSSPRRIITIVLGSWCNAKQGIAWGSLPEFRGPTRSELHWRERSERAAFRSPRRLAPAMHIRLRAPAADHAREGLGQDGEPLRRNTQSGPPLS